MVPNVMSSTSTVSLTAGVGSDITVFVTESTSALTIEDASGRILLHAPVTSGSVHDPLPIGTWKVNGVQRNPKFHYNPELFWDASARRPQGHAAAGAEQPRRRRLDRPLEAALRNPWHARAIEDWPRGVARMRPADELGRRARGAVGQARNQGGVSSMRRIDRRRAERLRRRIVNFGVSFTLGALVATLLTDRLYRQPGLHPMEPAPTATSGDAESIHRRAACTRDRSGGTVDGGRHWRARQT